MSNLESGWRVGGRFGERHRFSFPLELQLAAKQHRSSVTDQRCGVCAERRAAHSIFRISKVVVVPQIDEIGSELKVQALGN